MILFVVLLVGFGVATAAIAGSKHRGQGRWFVGGLTLGLLALIVVACLPDCDPTRCRTCGCR